MNGPRRYSVVRWAALVLAVAAVNYISGRLGLLLALPPGFATAVWPPSGIALAALLLFGYRIWPGVLLGSFAMNIFVAMQAGPVTDWASAALVATCIGLGSSAQAAVGAWLIRRFVGFPSALLFEREIALFLLLGGPVSCLVAATVGIGTLVSAGLMPPTVAPFQWWTWWIGDTIGVLTVVPLVLILAAEPRAIWRARRWTVGAPLVVAFSIAVLAFVYASRSEQQRIDAASERLREALEVALTRGLESKLDLLYATGAQFEAHKVSRIEFRDFTSRVLLRYPGMQAISWNPRVTQRQRAAYEEQARAEGLAGFEVVELRNGLRAPAAPHDEHFPVYYVEPLLGNQAALGVDLGADPARLAMLERARRSGRPAVSEALTLAQESGQQRGVLVAFPVHRRSDVAGGQVTLAGFVVLVLRIGDVVAAALRPVAPDGVVVALDDDLAPEANRELLAPQAPGGAPSFGSAWSQTPIAFADRRWTLRHALTPAAAEGQRSLVAWAVLAGGMLFASLLGAFLLAVAGRATHVYRLMEETREAMIRLQDTQKKLVMAEKLAALGALVSGVSHEINTPIGIGVSAASQLQDAVKALQAQVAAGTLTRSGLQQFLAIGREGSDLILRNLERAAGLVRSFKQVAVDQATGERRRVNLKAHIEETLVSLRPVLKGTPHQLILECPEALELDTVPGALSQILINLVVNSLAHAFTPERPGTIRISASAEPGRFVLRFADDGCGITAEDLPKIFDPFFTTKRGQGGTGLGLSIVFNLVNEALGGTIEVASAPGQGTVLTISAPLR